MLKYLSYLFVATLLFIFHLQLSTFNFPLSTSPVSAQQYSKLEAVLDTNTPVAKTLSADVQVEVARIMLFARDGDVYLKGFRVGVDRTDGQGEFDGIVNILIYDNSDSSLVGAYPVASENPDLIEVSTHISIGKDRFKTYILRAVVSSSAWGNARFGFKDFKFATEPAPEFVNVPIWGNVMTLPSPVPTPTPTPTPTASPTPTPTPVSTTLPNPISLGFTSLSALGLSDGNTISATGSDDPDIYIVNDWGYKRLFLNPIIFNFYGHLGGFAKVKSITTTTRNMLVTSGLFRNCEINDPKVYGIETTSEDTGILHWVNTSGAQAVQDDPDFFKKVFCINNNEFNWYPKGDDYTSVNQIPDYTRQL